MTFFRSALGAGGRCARVRSARWPLAAAAAALVVAALPAAAPAATYRFDRKSATPALRSLTGLRALKLGPGDRVLLRRGQRWKGPLAPLGSGTAARPIVVKAYGRGARPTVVGGASCVQLEGSYLLVSGLRLGPCRFAGVSVGGVGNVVLKNVMTDNVAGVHVRAGAVAARVLGNRMQDNNRMSVLTRGGNDDSGAWGVLVNGDRTEVAGNVISGSDAFSYDYGRDGSAVEIYKARDSFIHANRSIENHDFTELGGARSRGAVYAYNVVRSNLRGAKGLITRGAKTGFGPVRGTRFENNTVLLTGSGSEGVVCSSGCGPSILSLRNNIVQAAYKVGFADGPMDEDNNLLWGGLVQFRVGASTIRRAPRFAAASRGDLRLRATSPAVDRGVRLGYRVDAAAARVPLDGDSDGAAAPDLGAYERAGPRGKVRARAGISIKAV